MRDLTETKLFGASCAGVTTFGTTYLAGLDSVLLIVLSLLTMLAYHLFFSERKLL